MTGTGTQTDPYIPTTWSEFVTAVGTSGAYVECPKNLVLTSDTDIVESKLYVDSSGEVILDPVKENLSEYYENTFVFDMNKIMPYGLTESIVIKAANINGKGATIANIYTSPATAPASVFVAKEQTYMHSINFFNIYLENRPDNNYGVLFYTEIYGAFTLAKCKVSGVFSNYSSLYTASYSGSSWRNRFISCSFNIIFDGKSSLGAAYKNNNTVTSERWAFFEFCKIKISGKSQSAAYRDNVFVANYCYITGNCHSNLSFGCTATVFDIIVSEGQSVSYHGSSWGGHVCENSVINIDKVQGTFANALKQVTTAQLVDAEYLASIGFPIGVD